MQQTDQYHKLRKRIHRLETDLSYHVKRERMLENTVQAIIKGAISTEYGAFISLAEEILYTLTVGATKEKLRSICLKHLRKYLGTERTAGILARELNHACNGVIDNLLEDYPAFGAFEANLFSCMVLNIRNSLIMEVFDLGTPHKTAFAKHALIIAIRKLGNIRYLNYLKLLEKKDCTLGKNLLSLHDLSKFSNGKPEKNKD